MIYYTSFYRRDSAGLSIRVDDRNEADIELKVSCHLAYQLTVLYCIVYMYVFAISCILVYENTMHHVN